MSRDDAPATVARLLAWPGAIAWYLCWALTWTRSVWADPDGLVLGSFLGPDLIGTLWTWWWTAFSMVEGLALFDARWMYFPHGLFPFSQFNLVDALLATPLLLWLGPIAGYNVAVAAMLVLNGLAMHAVARWEGAGHLAALFAGTALLTADYVALELWIGRTTQAFLALLILGLGAWRRLTRGRDVGLWGALATGVLSALCALEYWYYGLFLGFGALALLATSLPAHDPDTRRIVLRNTIVAVASTIALTLPFVLVMLGPASTLPGTATTSGYPEASALAGKDPALHWAMNFAVEASWPLRPGAARPLVGTLPWTWLAATGLPLLVLLRRRLHWLLVAAVGWVLALGPFLRTGTLEWADLPLPWLLLHEYLPFFSRLWWPYRLASLVLVGLAVVAAMNLRDLAAKAGRRWGWLIPVAALIALSAELVASQRTKGVLSSPPVLASPAYEVVDGPVLPVPVMGANDKSTLHFAMQFTHQQPIFYGMGGHIRGHHPKPVEALLQDNSVLVALESLLREPPDELWLRGEDVAELHELGLRYVVLDRRCFGGDRRASALSTRLLRELLGKPLQADDTTQVWRLPPTADDLHFSVEEELEALESRGALPQDGGGSQ